MTLASFRSVSLVVRVHAINRMFEIIKDNVLEIFGPFELVDSANNDSRWRESRDMEN